MHVTASPPPVSQPIVEVHDLTVDFGRFRALHGLNTIIPKGCIGLLGPNGAGKTTLLKTLLGFVTPTSGSATVLGHPVRGDTRPIRRLVGLMPEQDCHMPGLSAVQFVAYAGELGGLPQNQAVRRAHEVLEYCGLGDARYRLVEGYSTGMKQRIKLAQALIHGPKLLFLDEPTNGLDPRGRNEMLDLIRSITQQGIVHVIVSSHILKDIERTCEYAVVVFQGQVRAQGTIRDLMKIEGHPFTVELKAPNPGFREVLGQFDLQVLEEDGYSLQVRGDLPPEEVVRRAFEAARKSESEIRNIEPTSRSLEEAFLEVIR